MKDKRVLSLSIPQLRELDRKATEEWNIPIEYLMERAGKAAAQETLDYLESHQTPKPWRILVLCGSGNNGGDGFAAARFMEKNAEVSVISLKPTESLKGETQHQRTKLKNIAVLETLDEKTITAELRKPSVILDAITGTGLQSRVEGFLDKMISMVNESGKPVISVDIPSGLNADTGLPEGNSIRAVRTVTFAAMKKGFLNPESKEWTGEIVVHPIGFPEALLEETASL